MPANRNRVQQERKRDEATARKASITGLTPQQRLDRIDQRLGKGVGATRERARLAKQIASA